MKNIFCLLIAVLPLLVFSQNDTFSSEYAEILLDGKPAFMNVNTGDIVSEIPNSAKRKSTNTSAQLSTGSSNTHSVAKGETLYSISKKYNTSVAQLKGLNSTINIDILSVGQEIVVNQNTEPTVTSTANTANSYTVKKGDTLYGISRTFNISVSDLKSKNKLTSNVLAIGQVLVIK